MKDKAQFVADLKYIEDVKKLAKDLADHFSAATLKQVVPYGTRTWRVEVADTMDPFKAKSIFIELIDFFGMVVGYNPEIDLLVFWEIKKNKKEKI